MKRPYKLLEGILVRDVDGEVILLDTTSDRVHQLNVTASLVWRSYQEGLAVDDIARRVANNFEVEEDKALADVTDVLRQLIALNILATP